MYKKTKLAKKDEYLIVVDLDGTVLSSNKDKHNNYIINEKNIKAINKLIELGHKVCIITGRPWCARTEEIYDSLGMNTIASTNNGAYIIFPEDYNKGFVNNISAMNRELIYEILNDSKVGPTIKNALIQSADGKNYVLDPNNIDWFNNYLRLDTDSFIKFDKDKKFDNDHYSIKLLLEADDEGIKDINIYIKRNWGNAFIDQPPVKMESGWYWECQDKFTNKSTALKLIQSYFNIDPRNTMSFGDGHNDLEMIVFATRGVAMRNGAPELKIFANDITDLDNNDGGVGDYLIKYFNLKV